MNNTEDHTTASQEALSSAANVSQVSGKKKKTRSHLYWMGAGVLAMGFVLLLSGHHEKTNVQPKTGLTIDNNYSESLNANLARLKALETQQTPSVPTHDAINTVLTEQHPVSKEMLARQNAPTTMYSATIPPQQQGNTASNNVQEATLAGQGADSVFGNQATMTTSVEATTIPHPDFTIASGEFLHAVLETAVNSDLPGMVRAVVSQPVYSYTGDRVIIPAGARLIGQYSSGIVQGQNRVMVVWNRVILPDGVAVQLNSPGTDNLGQAGQGADSVNMHFFARFGEAALLSIIGAGAATVGVNEDDQYNSASAYRMAIGQSFQQSAQQSLQGTLPMKPTLHVYQGANINVFVAHDLSFYRVLQGKAALPEPNF